MAERFLADENFPVDLAEWLREAGHDVIHAAASYPGASDRVLFDIAQMDNRIVLTFDRDFGDLIFRQKLLTSSGVVLFRVRRQPAVLLRTVVKSFFQAAPALSGRFTVVSPGQFRQALLRGR